MPHIPAMSRAQFFFIAGVIKTLPPECRTLVAYKFARALMGTNRDFKMATFIEACDTDIETIEKDLKL
jgi:hypothetical protein